LEGIYYLLVIEERRDLGFT